MNTGSLLAIDVSRHGLTALVALVCLIVLMTATQTGQALAKERMPFADAVIYFPFDWMFSVRRVLDAETERLQDLVRMVQMKRGLEAR